MASRSFELKGDEICRMCFGLLRKGSRARFDDGKIVCAGEHVTMQPMFDGED